jgi:sulfur-carrier protein
MPSHCVPARARDNPPNFMIQAPTITVLIPGALRPYCEGEAQLSASAATVRGMLDDLEQGRPSLHRNICDETGAVRRHLNVFVNSHNMRDIQGLDTPLATGDVVTIIIAVSGG